MGIELRKGNRKERVKQNKQLTQTSWVGGRRYGNGKRTNKEREEQKKWEKEKRKGRRKKEKKKRKKGTGMEKEDGKKEKKKELKGKRREDRVKEKENAAQYSFSFSFFRLHPLLGLRPLCVTYLSPNRSLVLFYTHTHTDQYP